MLEPWQWALAGLAAFLVGLSKTGVPGLGILSVVLFANALPPLESVGIALIVLISGDVVAVSSYRREANWSLVFKLMPWAIIGILIGVATIYYFKDADFKVIIGWLILGLVLLHVYRRRTAKGNAPEHLPLWASRLIGVGAGFTTMVANAAGPLMTIYLLSTGAVVDAVEFDPVAREAARQGITIMQVRDVTVDVVKCCLISGRERLSEIVEWPGKHFPIVINWGEYHIVDGKEYFCGMTRYGRDAQMIHNFELSTLVEVGQTISSIDAADSRVVAWRTRDSGGHWGEFAVMPLDDARVLAVGFVTDQEDPPADLDDLIRLAEQGARQVLGEEG